MKKFFLKKIIGYCLAGSLLVPVFAGCERSRHAASHKHRQTQLLMDTIVRVDICADPDADLGADFRKVWRRFRDINALMNRYLETSDVSKINRAFPEHVGIHEDTYYVLERALHYAELTKGVFDVTVGPLVDLWQEWGSKGELPPQDLIEGIKSRVGTKQVSLLGWNQVRLNDPGARVDLGGIAKGYAIDEAAKILRQEGLQNFLIDAGGDIYAAGHNCQGDLWTVGVRDPQDSAQLMDVVQIKDAAIATSGDYERFFMIQGQKWSHIVNPITGYPPRGVVSATVIAPNATQADALATALCVLGGERGVRFIDQRDGELATVIFANSADEDLKKYESGRYKKIKKTEVKD